METMHQFCIKKKKKKVMLYFLTKLMCFPFSRGLQLDQSSHITNASDCTGIAQATRHCASDFPNPITHIHFFPNIETPLLSFERSLRLNGRLAVHVSHRL